MDEFQRRGDNFTLVTRKPGFNLPTACPSCLPVFLYLKLARVPFQLGFNSIFPDSDQLPYLESGTYVAYNNESGGVIERLKEDGIADLDGDIHSSPEWISTKAMITSWLADAVTYELWLGSNGGSAYHIYYSYLPWLIGKVLLLKQTCVVKLRLGISKDNAEQREQEIYKRADDAYGALSAMLEEQDFLFDNRPSSLDALLLGNVLFSLEALPETSLLRSKLLEHQNLIKYADKLKLEFIEVGPSSPSLPQFSLDAGSSAPRRGPSKWSSKPKKTPKREKTEEEKTFRKRARYFLATQLVSVIVFLSIMGAHGSSEVEFDDDELE